MKTISNSLIVLALILCAFTAGDKPVDLSGNETGMLQYKQAEEEEDVPNTLSDSEKAAGWKLLFDGKTSAGWRGALKESFPAEGWTIADGAITIHAGGNSAHGGDIVSVDEYSAFELKVDFKITKGANSGIKYFVIESEKHPGAVFGLEYQVLDDDEHPDAKLFTTFPGSRRCAGLYDLIKPENVRFNGIGQWNQAIIKVFPNNHVEHWLNGFKTLEYERGSEAFRALIKGSKYVEPSYNADGPFGEAPKGHILLQDHGDEVSYRNIKIKILD